MNANNDTQRDLGASRESMAYGCLSPKPALHISPALGKGGFHAWRRGSCVAPKDCRFGSSVSAFTYNVDFGFWINSTCCQGNCQAPIPPGMLPPESSHGVAEDVVG